MKLILTLSSTNKNKSIMDILAQFATEAVEQKGSPAANSGMFGMLFKGAAKTVDLLGGGVANSVFSMLKPALGKIINENLQQNKIPASFTVEDIVKENERVKVTLSPDSISYDGVINRFLPGIMESVRQQNPENDMWKVYDVISDDQQEIVSAVLDTINNNKKDKIIGMMISRHKKVICEKFSEFLAAEKIEIAVKNIKVII